MRLFVFGLIAALLSSFNSYASPDYVSPKVETFNYYWCMDYANNYLGGNSNPTKAKLSDCIEYATTQYNNRFSANCGGTSFNISYTHSSTSSDITSLFGTSSVSNECGSSETPNTQFGKAVYREEADSYTCPPDDFPDYTKGPEPISNDLPDSKVCRTPFNLCPKGNFKYAVTNSTGAEQCVPIRCPSTGTTKSIFSWRPGGSGEPSKVQLIPFGQPGNYCDGKCMYSVESSGMAYDGASSVTAISHGSICGSGAPNDAYWTPASDLSSCVTESLDTGSYMTCTPGTVEPQPDPEPDPAPDIPSLDENQDLSKIPEANCGSSSDPIACIGNQITDAVENAANQQNQMDSKRINAVIDAYKQLSEYDRQRREAREQAANNDVLTALRSNTENISESINSLGTVFSSGGGGTGSNNGTGLTEDYEGDGNLDGVDAGIGDADSRLENAANQLEQAVSQHENKFNQNDALWTDFKNIPNKLPSELSCSPFDFSVAGHQYQFDLCQYHEIVKTAISFIFMFLTAWRLFFMASNLFRTLGAINSA